MENIIEYYYNLKVQKITKSRENYIIKDNKKILLQSPIKGKLIRIYRNNDKNCKMCFRNERKNREFGPVIKIKESNIFFPENFKKGKSNYFNTED